MSDHVLQFTAAGTQYLNVPGYSYQVLRSDTPIRIAVDTGGFNDREMGMGEQWPTGFQRLAVQSDTAQTVTIAVHTDARVIDRRAVVTTTPANISLQKRAYAGGQTFAAGAGLFAQVQLWNPATSTVRLMCRRYVINAVGDLVRMYSHNAQLLVKPGDSQNKYLGEPVGQGHVRVQDSPTSIPGFHMALLPTDANGTPAAFEMYNSPIIIPPGYGLVAQTYTTGAQVTAHFEWDEELL